jgi:hypothetical protein
MNHLRRDGEDLEGGRRFLAASHIPEGKVGKRECQNKV